MELNTLKSVVASVFLGLFSGVWVWIVVDTWRFNPTTTEPTLILDTAFVTISGAHSAAVGAATAAAVGIKIQKLRNAGTDFLRATQEAAQASKMVVLAVLLYLVVGVLVLIAWLHVGKAAPDVVQSFALGALGWGIGAIAGVVGASE